jgi:5-methylcytosine-specific restriction endonuclease McrA
MEGCYTPFDSAKLVLGSLCKRGHDYKGTGRSLRRIASGSCVDCLAAWRAANTDKIRANLALWRTANPERKRAFDTARHAANREKELARMAAWRAANSEKARLNRAAWRAANPDKARADLAAWQAANPDKIRVYNRRRRDRKAAAPALRHITAAQSRQRLKDFGNACAFCGATNNLHLDHFLPLSFGNALVIGNAIPACQRCNCSKSNADPHDWYSRQPFFNQKRWDRILKVLGKDNHHHGQMTLV